MTPLEQAATEQVDQLREETLRYKFDNKLTWLDISEETELTLTTLHNFCNLKKGISMINEYKIRFGLGLSGNTANQ